MSAVRKILTEEGEARVVQAIRSAEARTSGEIRVHVERRCAGDPMIAAGRWFARLKMHETSERNGVLFYIAVDDRKFAIVGDAGIHAKVGDDFWNGVRDILRDAFARGEASEGLVDAIGEAGARLAEHFPHRGDDRNELPDEISG